MFVTFTVARYSNIKAFMGFLSMVYFRVILIFLKNKPSFSKLMGSGKNGTFDIEPDLHQWAYLFVWESRDAFLNFQQNSLIFNYIHKFSDQNFTFYLEPIQSHGLWDNTSPFGHKFAENLRENEKVVVLTRASIKVNKAADFWRNVPDIATGFSQNEGFIYSVGVGEAPLFKQATLSVWENETSMKAFAYKHKKHADVIKKTRTQQWYSEELFARFRLLGGSGHLPFSI
jgi:hypothetical protein